MKNEQSTTKFTAQVESKQAEYEKLRYKFEHIVDPVERYIKRMEMKEVQTWLEEKGIHVDIP